MEHRLKTIDVYFDKVSSGEKTFEVRKNDRFYQAGDIVEMVRCNSSGFVVNNKRTIRFQIGSVLQGGQFGIEPNYCVFSLMPIEKP